MNFFFGLYCQYLFINFLRWSKYEFTPSIINQSDLRARYTDNGQLLFLSIQEWSHSIGFVKYDWAKYLGLQYPLSTYLKQFYVPRGHTRTCQTAICPESDRARPLALQVWPRTSQIRPATRADSCTGVLACGPSTQRYKRARCRQWSPLWPGTKRNRLRTLPVPCTMTAGRSSRSSATTTPLFRFGRRKPWRWCRRPFKWHPGMPTRP